MLTETKVIGIYCIVDDILKSIGHSEDVRRRVSDGEIITTALVSALYFGGHHDNARGFMIMTGLVPQMLDKSRFNRRLHAVGELLYGMFVQLGHCLKSMAGASDYVLDSFPVPVCDNIRIANCRLARGESWRGRQSSMRRYFYGVRVQMLVTGRGVPVEFVFTPGRESDVRAMRRLPLAVAAESRIFADAAYTDYHLEDHMRETDGVDMMVQRKKNSLRPDKPWTGYVKECMRKRIETTFSELKALFPKKIHAVTFAGFLIKVVAFILALTVKKIAL